MRHLRAEPALVTSAQLGEGPAWDQRRRRLLWVDIPAGEVHLFDPVTVTDDVLAVDQDVGAVVPHVSGGFAVALRAGFGRLSDTGDLEMVADLSRPGVRMNDGKCAPDGAFWAGTMADDKTPGAAALYRLGPDGTATTMLSDLTISNGLAWSADGRQLHFIDTPTRRVDVFDVDPDTQCLHHRRPVVELKPGLGNPDGMTIDHDGCLWVAMAGGWAVHRYRPDGTLDAVVDVPVRQVTSCCFGGTAGDELFITTGRQGVETNEVSLAGSVFWCRPGVSGPSAAVCASR